MIQVPKRDAGKAAGQHQASLQKLRDAIDEVRAFDEQMAKAMNGVLKGMKASAHELEELKRTVGSMGAGSNYVAEVTSRDADGRIKAVSFRVAK